MAAAPDAERIEVALAVVRNADGCYLVSTRPDGTHLAGAWEFPGGKIEPDEHPVRAAQRELREETGLQVSHFSPLTVVVHDYPERSVRLHAYYTLLTGESTLENGSRWSWVHYDELLKLEMPEGNRQILRALGWRR